MKVDLRVVGYVRSGITERKEMPRLGVGGTIEVLPEYAPALLRIEKHSHIWIMVWLDRAERDVLQVIPRGITDRSAAGLHGVFAVRAPVRPNPIGLTLARMIRIEGTRIHVDRVDFLDGTPVIDLKPYFSARDAVFSAANLQIGKPASREALHDSLLMQAVNFHGEDCADLELAVRVYEHFRAEVLNFEDPRGLHVTAPISRPHLIDALMGMTGATPGRGTLLLASEELVRFEWDGSVNMYDLHDPSR